MPPTLSKKNAPHEDPSTMPSCSWSVRCERDSIEVKEKDRGITLMVVLLMLYRRTGDGCFTVYRERDESKVIQTQTLAMKTHH
jgi:hypothetical protein